MYFCVFQISIVQLNKIELETLAERREKLCRIFAQKWILNPKLKKTKKNIKTHQMNTRHPEKFEVDHARSERLKISPKIYMQNLLNEIYD